MNGLLDAYDATSASGCGDGTPFRGRVSLARNLGGRFLEDRGGTTWLWAATIRVEPDLSRIGNPAPDFNGDMRKGDNLYTEHGGARRRHGQMKWYFQFTPHDVMDWDAVEIPCWWTPCIKVSGASSLSRLIAMGSTTCSIGSPVSSCMVRLRRVHELG
jgi:alcohol dehydrogenase (cytochrome c)